MLLNKPTVKYLDKKFCFILQQHSKTNFFIILVFTFAVVHFFIVAYFFIVTYFFQCVLFCFFGRRFINGYGCCLITRFPT